MYIFICEDSLDGILTGIYDAWSFKIQHKDLSHDDIRLASHEPENYELLPSPLVFFFPSLYNMDERRRSL